jgi:hypothetical protein
MNFDREFCRLSNAFVRLYDKNTGLEIGSTWTGLNGRWSTYVEKGVDVRQCIVTPEGFIGTCMDAGKVTDIAAGADARTPVAVEDVSLDLNLVQNSIQDFENTVWRKYAEASFGTTYSGLILRSGGDIIGHSFEYLYQTKQIAKPVYSRAMGVARPLARFGTEVTYLGWILTAGTISYILIQTEKHPDQLAEEVGGLEKVFYDYFKAQGWIDPETRRIVLHAIYDWIRGRWES